MAAVFTSTADYLLGAHTHTKPSSVKVTSAGKQLLKKEQSAISSLYTASRYFAMLRTKTVFKERALYLHIFKAEIPYSENLNDICTINKFH